MPDHDTDPVLEERLRQAPWDLAVPESLLADVRSEVGRRRRRRVLGRWGAGAGAVAAVLVAAVVLPALLTSRTAAPGPAAAVPASTTSASAASASAASASAASAAAGTSAVTVGGWTFDVPAGWTLDPSTSRATARFGPDGLQNDGGDLRPSDMRVQLETRAMTVQEQQKMWVTLVTPQPTVRNPGPPPAGAPTDVAAAALTVVDVESAKGVPAGSSVAVTGVALGPARLVRFDAANGLLFVQPQGSGSVLMFQVAGASPDLLVSLARSGRS